MNTNSIDKELTGYPSIDKPWLKYYSNEAVKYVSDRIEQNAYQYMVESNKQRMHYVAIEYFGVKVTYKKLYQEIEKVAKVLRSKGISKGDFVTLCLPNIPEIIYFVYALNRIGAVACLIDPRTNAEGILERANNSKSKLLITIIDIVNEKINLISEQLFAQSIVIVSPAESTSIKSAKSIAVKFIYAFKHAKLKSQKYIKYQNFIKSGREWTGKIDGEFTSNTPAIIVYTSGTTGSSKGVVISNENIIASKKLIEYGASKVEKNASFLGVIPFFSAYGSCTGMNNSLCNGWKIIMIPQFKPNEFSKLLLKHKTPSALGVPRFWSSFAEAGTNTDLSFLKNPICGGDKISPISVQKINRYLIEHNAGRLKIGYGASEFAGGIVITLDSGLYKENSTGEILPGVIGMVIDPNTGDELTYNEEGELCFYSPTMMMGYFNNEDETNQITIFKNGIKYYRTGDKGHIDENGCVYIVDRYKRVMMRPDGHTVHASPIEDVIMKHNLVENCAVVGLPLDSDAGVIPIAFIKLKNSVSNYTSLVDEIDDLCLKEIPERDKAHAYVIVESFPYTLMGKIDYKALEKNRLSEMDLIIKDYSFLSDTNKENHN